MQTHDRQAGGRRRDLWRTSVPLWQKCRIVASTSPLKFMRSSHRFLVTSISTCKRLSLLQAPASQPSKVWQLNPARLLPSASATDSAADQHRNVVATRPAAARGSHPLGGAAVQQLEQPQPGRLVAGSKQQRRGSSASRAARVAASGGAGAVAPRRARAAVAGSPQEEGGFVEMLRAVVGSRTA